MFADFNDTSRQFIADVNDAGGILTTGNIAGVADSCDQQCQQCHVAYSFKLTIWNKKKLPQWDIPCSSNVSVSAHILHKYQISTNLGQKLIKIGISFPHSTVFDLKGLGHEIVDTHG